MQPLSSFSKLSADLKGNVYSFLLGDTLSFPVDLKPVLLSKDTKEGYKKYAVQHVRGLDFSETTLTVETLKKSALVFSNVRSLTGKTTAPTREFFEHVCQFSSLKHLRLTGAKKTSDIETEVQPLAKLPQLEWVSLHSFRLTPQAVQTIASLASLRFLSYTTNHDCSPVFQTFIDRKNQFESLHLSGLTKVENSKLQALIHAQENLSSLSLKQCYKITDETVQLICTKLSKLHTLSLHIPSARGIQLDRLTQAAFIELPRLQHLHTLRLDVCSEALTSPAFENIAKLAQLRKLLFESAVTMQPQDLRTLADHLPELQELRLQLSNQSTAQVADFEYLFQRKKTLKDLSLVASHTVNDSTIKTLAKELSELEELTLEQLNKISAESLKDIAKMPKLQKLNVIFCSPVTQEDIEKEIVSVRKDINVTFTDFDEL